MSSEGIYWPPGHVPPQSSAPTFGDDPSDVLIHSNDFSNLALAGQGSIGSIGNGWVSAGEENFSVVTGRTGGSSRAIRGHYGTPGGAGAQEGPTLERDLESLSEYPHWFVEWWVRWSVGADPTSNGNVDGFKYTRFFFEPPVGMPGGAAAYLEYPPVLEGAVVGFGGYDETRYLPGTTRVIYDEEGGSLVANDGTIPPFGYTYFGDADPESFPWYDEQPADDKGQVWPFSTWADGQWYRQVYEFYGAGPNVRGWEKMWMGDTKILDRSGKAIGQYLPASKLEMIRFFMNTVQEAPDAFTVDITEVRCWERPA